VQHLPLENCRRLGAMVIAAGRHDEFANIPVTSRRLVERLRELGCAAELDDFDGRHADQVGERLRTQMLPFFGRSLSFAP
jgi:hypothetical protein